MTTKLYDATGPRELMPDKMLSETIVMYPVLGTIGPVLVPPVEVPRQFGVFPSLGGRPRLESLVRAPGAVARRLGFGVGSVGYFCQGYAAAVEIPGEDLGNADISYRLAESSARFLTNALTVAFESNVASLLNENTSVSSVFIVGSAWNAAANAGKALQAVEGVLQFVEDTGGYRPNVIGFGKSAWRSFAANSSVNAACGGWVTPARVAEVFRVSTVAIAQNLRDASDEGLALTPNALFDDLVYVLRQPESPTANFEARHSATCYWLPSGERASVPGAFAAYRHPFDSKIHAQPIEVACWMQSIILDPQLGAAIKGCNSAQSGGLV